MSPSNRHPVAPARRAYRPEHFATVRLPGSYAKIMSLESRLRLMKADEEARPAQVLRMWSRSRGQIQPDASR